MLRGLYSKIGENISDRVSVWAVVKKKTLKLPYGGRGDISKQVRGSEDFIRKKKMATPRQHVKNDVFFFFFFSKGSYLQPDYIILP